MPSRDAQFDSRLASIFQAEAAEHVQRMQSCLTQLEGGPQGAVGKPMELLFRAAHSLKGAARAVGHDEVELVCHAAEGLLSGLQRGRLAWSPAIADSLHEVVAGLEKALTPRGAPPGALAALLPRLERLERAEGGEAPALAASATAAAPALPAPAAASAATMPGAEQTVRIGVDRLGRLLYQVEELVGAKLLAGHQVMQLDEAIASAAACRLRSGAAGDVTAAGWQEHEARLRGLRGAAAREQRQLAGAVDALLADVKKTLLLPVGSLRPFLVAAVRELTRSQGKEVDLRIAGDEIEMDRRLLENLREPLVHMVRNAISHGIETPQVRLAAGKPAKGVLEIVIAAKGGGRVEITVADDGAGVDTARLAEAARALQLPVPDEADAAELLPLVFGHGVSTAHQLTRVSGRGIGLAIARETVERMGGTIAIRSVPGQGTTFTIALALSLATYRAVEVRSSGSSFLLPTARVERCVRFAAGDLRMVGSQQVVAVGEHDLPLVSLAGLLGLPASTVAAPRINCVVLAAGERRIAVAVDEIGGEQEVLGKPVDMSVTQSPLVTGAAVLAGGQPVAILNVPELVRSAVREGGRSLAAPIAVLARPRGCSVLVAEDSITSRTLLKNILELAGHRVEVAVDGADALDKLRSGGFDLVVSDVEMPRLDGIALTEAIRRDKALAHLPVVLVTSLASPADRERGAEAGANAYIVKSSFDQGNLLAAIAELV
jgi:two-component system chemotaxis sensor kinase CheA